MQPAILRALAYVLTLGLGLGAAALAAAGFGEYNAEAGTYSVTVNVETFVAYVVTMIGGGGTALTALLRGWKPLK